MVPLQQYGSHVVAFDSGDVCQYFKISTIDHCLEDDSLIVSAIEGKGIALVDGRMIYDGSSPFRRSEFSVAKESTAVVS